MVISRGSLTKHNTLWWFFLKFIKIQIVYKFWIPFVKFIHRKTLKRCWKKFFFFLNIFKIKDKTLYSELPRWLSGMSQYRWYGFDPWVRMIPCLAAVCWRAWLRCPVGVRRPAKWDPLPAAFLTLGMCTSSVHAAVNFSGINGWARFTERN